MFGLLKKPVCSVSETDEEWENRIRAEYEGKVNQYNVRMTSKHCPMAGTYCTGDKCVHFSGAWTLTMSDARWAKVRPARCKLWGNDG